MFKILLCSIIFITFSSCLRDNEQLESDYFLVDELENQTLEDTDKFPIANYYAKHNILLLSKTNEIFYHNKYFSCGTGFQAGDPPRSIDLTEGELKKFDSLKDVGRLIASAESTPRLVIIASDLDTIRSPMYPELKEMLKNIERCYHLKTRRLTKDEIHGLTWFKNQ